MNEGEGGMEEDLLQKGGEEFYVGQTMGKGQPTSNNNNSVLARFCVAH
jgi:hypothetical protein